MALLTQNGMSIDDLTTTPNGPGLVQQLGNQVDQLYGGSVANAAALPASGKFAGQRVWLVDSKSFAEWNGTAWVKPTLTAVTYQAGWSTFGAGSQVERNGPMVTLYLGAGRTSNDAHGAASPVLQLPAGFYPKRTVSGWGVNGDEMRAYTISTAGLLTRDTAKAAGTNVAAFTGTVTFPAAP